MEKTFLSLSAAGCNVINIDQPGFGSSPPPPQPFSTDDYADCVGEIIQSLSLCSVTVVGHSFGGRIAILLATLCKEVKQLVLVSSAGIKPRFSLKKKIRIWRYKRAKKKGKDTAKYGSIDYLSLNGEMKETFVRVVNRHLDKELSKIHVPTLIVWGDEDKETPMYMAKKLKRKIEDSGLVVFHGGHFAYLENNIKFNLIIKNFVLGGN
jgi:pimeloyl-ACP methyl ester carboxylesterase